MQAVAVAVAVWYIASLECFSLFFKQALAGRCCVVGGIGIIPHSIACWGAAVRVFTALLSLFFISFLQLQLQSQYSPIYTASRTGVYYVAVFLAPIISFLFCIFSL